MAAGITSPRIPSMDERQDFTGSYYPQSPRHERLTEAGEECKA